MDFSIPFDITARARGQAVLKRVAFWETLRPWFLSKGYTLYALHCRHSGRSEKLPEPVCSFPIFGDIDGEAPDHPYAYFGMDEEETAALEAYAADKTSGCSPPYPPLFAPFQARIFFAQDAHKRHVAIRVVKDATEEYRILRYLSKQDDLLSSEGFQCVLPVLDMLQYGKYWFVVMPRWGTSYGESGFPTVRACLRYMECCLTGMAFLHRHRIAHADIRISNTLTNHFGSEQYRMASSNLRDALHRQDRISHAIIDFDRARMLPPGIDYLDAAYVRGWHPLNPPSAGELLYDPFVRDVGTLGGMFCFRFQGLIEDMPLMAPFLDRMVTIDIQQRFTAAKALDFLHHVLRASLAYDQLSCRPAVWLIGSCEDDRWSDLPHEFVEQWATYCAPRHTATAVFLHGICKTQAGWQLVRASRHIGRFIRIEL
ncbi:hypothetical protein BV25DRAFT_1578720 [Artomyces pyxidatus]|uniref:Uncharacterized protein n=1 Tax=Artomyces pyxidatus TaxID=48021 RepID=A0ACB8SKG6_9AGAM|nr:hypothetical protein BV25DRAFT_1578720 [Artomyces pyxidatus]